MLKYWFIPACCVAEPSAEEIKLSGSEYHEGDGYAQVVPVLPPKREGTCGECCEQEKDTNEVVVVPQTPSVPQNRNAFKDTPSFANSSFGVVPPVYDANAERMECPIPPPSPGQQDTFSHVREYPPPPVPQIVGLSNLVNSSVAEFNRQEFEVDLVREGPQWSNLGMLVSPNAANPDNLNIDEIDECSLLGAWNAKVPSTNAKVLEGDVIVAVNGQTGRDLIREIQQTSDQGSRIKLCIVRAETR